MNFSVHFHPEVISSDLKRLPKNIQQRIFDAIRERLTIHPEAFGKRLTKSLKNYWRLRVGDYRIVYQVEHQNVNIFAIQHCGIIYQHIESRIRSLL